MLLRAQSGAVYLRIHLVCCSQTRLHCAVDRLIVWGVAMEVGVMCRAYALRCTGAAPAPLMVRAARGEEVERTPCW